jgi:cell cycle arrest protein BUB2
MKILRIFPPLQASSVISITVALVKDVPEDLYSELVKHPYSV